MKMSSKVYDILKFIQFLLPILGTAYLGLSEIWNFPYGDQIMATVTVLTAAIGGLLKWSSYNYYKADEAVEDEVPDTIL